MLIKFGSAKGKEPQNFHFIQQEVWLAVVIMDPWVAGQQTPDAYEKLIEVILFF